MNKGTRGRGNGFWESPLSSSETNFLADPGKFDSGPALRIFQRYPTGWGSLGASFVVVRFRGRGTVPYLKLSVAVRIFAVVDEGARRRRNGGGIAF